MGTFEIDIESSGAQQVHFIFHFGISESSGNLLEGNLAVRLISNIINP